VEIRSCRMGVNITERRHTSISLNVEQEAKPVVVVVSRGGEARTQKAPLGGTRIDRDSLGVVHDIAKL
jgi:hypothetical protein